MNAPSDTTPQERFSGVQAHLTQHSTASHPPTPRFRRPNYGRPRHWPKSWRGTSPSQATFTVLLSP